MDGLSSILSNYDEDESDGEDEIVEINGVKDVQDQDAEDPLGLEKKVHQEKLPLLPLPSIFKKVDPEDDKDNNNSSEFHDGKIRNFAYMRGNWASFIYIPLKTESLESLLSLVEECLNEVLPENSYKLNKEFHLSLSKTLVLRHHWIEPIVNSLKSSLTTYQRFDLCFDSFEVYTNDEKTRTFLGIKCHPSSPLFQIIQECDKCLNEYKLDPYYEDPSFHISLAWTVGDDFKRAKKDIIPLLNAKWFNLCDNESDIQFFNVDQIEFKSGNKLYKFFLS